MDKELIFPLSEQYEEYLIDESKWKGFADSISFPKSKEEIIYILKSMSEKNIPVTIQGGKTGIVGGASPMGGHILNISFMNKVIGHNFCEDGSCLLTVEPGINLMELKKEIGSLSKNKPLFWPPEPTETSATVGGVAACNAKGICAYLYGDSKKYITALRLIQSDGSVKDIVRGEEIREGCDLIDLVLGTEGILGVFSQLTLKLIPKPKEMWGITFFFEYKQEAARFVDAVKKDMPKSSSAAIAALEYIDRNTIDIVENRKSVMSKLKDFPDIQVQFQAMLYFEIHGDEEGIEELAEVLMELSGEYNSDIDQAWAVSGETEIEKMRAFRHGAAETANLLIEEARKTDEHITKLGGDMFIENKTFEAVLMAYEKKMAEAGIYYCIFGHALENHLHINILPVNLKEFELGKKIMRDFALETIEAGGKIICEHGIGKLKKNLFDGMISNEYLQKYKILKSEFDPQYIFGKGNIWFY